MLQLVPQSKIFVATQPIDFRKGIDSIAALCKLKLSLDPLSGAIFAFCNRSKTSIKFLCYDGQGFWLCLKRLSTGKFKSWPNNDPNLVQIVDRELYTIIHNGNPKGANFSDDWRPISPP